MAAAGKHALKLSGSDYIQVEWRHNAATVTTEAVTVKRGLVGDIATIGADWLRHRPRLTVILGTKGAGKSATALLLTHQLLEQRGSNSTSTPVPVLLHVKGWDPAIPLLEWVSKQLAVQYGLSRSNGPGSVDTAVHLAGRGDLLLVLDGFDEIAEPRHVAALARLREAMDASDIHMVVTSRIAEFEAAQAADDRRIERMSEVMLQPVSRSKARHYLRKNGTSEHWAAVFEQLAVDDSPVAQALTTPLMVFLCREVYQRQTPDRATFEGFADKAAVEQHLIAHFLPTVYSIPAAPDFTGIETNQDAMDPMTERAIRYLGFIAAHMRRTGQPGFAWWQLPRSTEHQTFMIALAVIVMLNLGTMVGLVVALEFGLTIGLAVGLITMIAFGLMSKLMLKSLPAIIWDPQENPNRLVLNRNPFGKVLWGELIPSLGVGIVAGLAVTLVFGWAAGLALGLTVPLLIVMLEFLDQQTPIRLKLLSPANVLAEARTTFAATALAAGLGFGLAFGLVVGPVAGSVLGSTTAIIVATIERAWFSYRLAHFLLAFPNGRRVPWRFMAFLEDARRRGVLRQVGATYEFRHEALQTYLSEPVEAHPSANASRSLEG